LTTMHTSKPIIFFGTEDFSLTALTGLIEADYTIAAVVTKPDSKKGRGQHLAPPSVKVLAARHNIPVWQPVRLSDITDDIRTIDSPLGILVSYGKIIPQSIIDLFSPGIINVHPSLLPRYRGPSPIESAILHGDERTGVSIMQLSAAMDAGPVYAAREYALKGTETGPELSHTLATIGSDVLLETLPSIIDGSLTPSAQRDDDATYTKLLRKEDALLDPTTCTAADAERQIRAYVGFPKTKLTVRNHTIIIMSAHISDKQNTPLDVRCQNGAFLCIDTLIAPSGKRMSVEDFLRGYA